MPAPYALVRAFLVAALVAGLSTAALHLLVSERYVDQAIALEEAALEREEAATGSAPARHEELFSRRTQKSGLVAGSLLYALAAGALFAGVYALASPRLPVRGVRAGVALLGGATVLAAVVVPFLKYPANPPGVGDPDTLARRQLLYVGCLLLSVAGLWLAARLSRSLGPRLGRGGSLAVGALFYGVWVAALLLLLPGRADPVHTPTRLLWQFRAASLCGQILFWVLFCALFAALLSQRAPSPDPSPAARGRGA